MLAYVLTPPFVGEPKAMSAVLRKLCKDLTDGEYRQFLHALQDRWEGQRPQDWGTRCRDIRDALVEAEEP